ncbi:MAG: glycerol-3-phosphate dehydrogenase C-terminal domain-containing protein, partial [Actinomycetota bacterium]
PTDTPVDSDDSSIVVDPEDVSSILETVNSTMNDSVAPLTADDVELATVGVRPLIKTGGDEGTYSASRRHELYHHVDRGVDNLWTIGGGKWTTGRATAEQMVEALFDNELRDRPRRRFASRRAEAFGAFAWAEDAAGFLRAAAQELELLGVDRGAADTVARAYGSEYVRLLELVRENPDLARPLSASCPEIAAQVVFAVTDEAARTLSDVVDRRLIVGTVGRVTDDTIDAVARIAGPLWGWDEARIIDETRREINRRLVVAQHGRTPTDRKRGGSLTRGPKGCEWNRGAPTLTRRTIGGATSGAGSWAGSAGSVGRESSRPRRRSSSSVDSVGSCCAPRLRRSRTDSTTPPRRCRCERPSTRSPFTLPGG